METHFGYETIEKDDKVYRVAQVFDSVAEQYDLMNDLMSGGLHRLWKAFTVAQAGVRSGFRVLDIAGGTGDLAVAFAKAAGKTGEVWLADINENMLQFGRDKLLNKGHILPVAVCDAECLPFPENYFDRVVVSFGLRNMTDKERTLSEMYRVLKHGGKLLILEFSQVSLSLQKIYDKYSFSFLPWLGEQITGDRDSYRYLAESIRMHPNQDALKEMMHAANFNLVKYFNLTAGVVALHTGIKI